MRNFPHAAPLMVYSLSTSGTYNNFVMIWDVISHLRNYNEVKSDGDKHNVSEKSLSVY